MEISRETFQQMETDDKLNVLFDYVVASFTTCKNLDDKTEKLERKSIKWGAVGGVMSAIGAYLAAMFINHMTK
jgi:hypothetical protein